MKKTGIYTILIIAILLLVQLINLNSQKSDIFAYDAAQVGGFGPGLVSAFDSIHLPAQKVPPLGAEDDWKVWKPLRTEYGTSIAVPTPSLIMYGAAGLTDIYAPTQNRFGTGFVRMTWTGRSTNPMTQYIALGTTHAAYAPYDEVTAFQNVGCDASNTINAHDWSCYDYIRFNFYNNFYANGGDPTDVSQTASLFDGSVTLTGEAVDVPPVNGMTESAIIHHYTISLNYLANQYITYTAKYFDTSNIREFMINGVLTDYQQFHKSYQANALDGAVIMYYDYVTLGAGVIENDTPSSLSIATTTVGIDELAWLGWTDEPTTVGASPPTGYHIYRATAAAGPYISMAKVNYLGAGTDNEYTDTEGNPLLVPQNYCYKVLTMDNGPTAPQFQRLNTINASYHEPLLDAVSEICITLPPKAPTFTPTASTTPDLGTPTVTPTITVSPTRTPFDGKELEDPHVYPNPYNPNDKREIAKRFVVDNVPVGTKVYIYAMDGALVKEGEYKSNVEPFKWDGRNKNGTKVVAGLYYLVLEPPEGEKKVYRILVCYKCDPVYNPND